jgi:cytochrome c oxidase cbb3-type subunit 4
MELEYTLLREFADSWGLLAMALFFLGAIVWVLLPGSRRSANDAANIPFREDEK